MAKSALELAVETGKWDAGLKKAKNALDSFTEANGGLQKALSSDSDKMKQFVQMMGRTESTAKTAKGQMNDYKGTIEALTMQYNRMTDAQKSAVGPAYLQAIEQMKQRYKGVADEVAKINQELKQTSTLSDGIKQGGTSGGGLFGGGKLDGMLQVFGGNLMTKGAGMLAGLASEMGDMVKQGIELAKQGEGIRIAFQRLGRGDILDGLRQATHGTVTDLELMKAAVKFNDFKLPLEELGTMLAFAQQKAKDTGQSVDYMVDSIVTGLGRKSLMILDNLGLSAAQIKERMAETGDMTKAVGAIIREEMAKAGDYVETAADRATQANVQLENAMTRLGETFQPLTDTASSMWTSIKIGALDLLNNAVKPLIKALQEAGALGQKARGNAGYENLGGDAKINRLIANLGDGKSPKAYRTYKAQMAEFDRYANSLKFKIAAFGDDKSGVAQSAVAKLQTELAGVLTMRMEYDRRAQELHKKATAKNIEANKEEEQSIDSLKKKLAELQEQRKKAIAAGDNDLSKSLLKQINQVKADIKGLGGTTTTTHKTTTAEQIAFDINKAGISSAKGVDTMPSIFGMLKDSGAAGINGAMGSIVPDLSADIEKQQTLVDKLREKWAEAGGELRDSYIAQIIAAEDKLRSLKDEQEVSTRNTPQWDAQQDISKQWKVGKNGQLTQQGKSLAEDGRNVAAEWQSAASAISAVGAAMSQIEDPAAKVMGTIAQAIATIALTFASSLKGTVTPWDWIAAAATGTATMISTISAIHSATGYANGGIVGRAGGGFVPGNSMSGDNVLGMVDGVTPVGLNSGELVLNKAQQANLASALESNGPQNMRLEAVVTAEQIRFMLNSNGRRTGRGEYVTTNFR